MASPVGEPNESGRPLTGGDSPSGQLPAETVRELYETHSRELVAFLVGVLKSGDLAEEVAQITFHRLMEVGHEARPETIKGWLFKVAFHEAMALRRRRAIDEKSLKKYLSRRDLLPSSPMIHEQLVKREDVERLKGLLTRLPADQQHVVRERMYEEKTFAVIAAELGVPLGTVLTRMRLAMEKLQKWWDRGDSQ